MKLFCSSLRIFFLLLLWLTTQGPVPVRADEPANLSQILKKLPDNTPEKARIRACLSTLFTCYPCRDLKLEGPDRIYVIMENGAEIIFDDGQKKTFEEKLEHPDLEDMFWQAYPSGPLNGNEKFMENFDPGRYRVDKFFKAVYGASANEVRANLTKVNFCGHTVPFNRLNGAAQALEKAGREIAPFLKTSPQWDNILFPLGGTFYWRVIAGTNLLSAHSWGIAIDLNANYSGGGYWRWDKSKNPEGVLRKRRRFPFQLVDIFERNGFIWGGKWSHYDFMHFEYRPEMLANGRSADARPPLEQIDKSAARIYTGQPKAKAMK